MRDFLSVMWSGADTHFEVSGPFDISCRGDDDGPEIIRRLRLECPDNGLRSLVLREDYFAAGSDTVRLVSVCCSGNPASAPELDRLLKPPLRCLLLFALQHRVVWKNAYVVFPGFFDRKPIVLSPNNGTPLLCAASLDFLGDRTIQVLALEPKPARCR